jgi:hypothetical protein
MGRNYSFKLYFRNEDVEKALLALADMVWIYEKEIHQITLPNGKEIKINLGTRVRTYPDISFGCDISILFLPDEVILKYVDSYKDTGSDYRVQKDEKTCYRIGNISFWIRSSEQYTEFGFMAVTTNMSFLFVESDAIHQRFLELLKAANGILGLIDVESWEYLLLKHPERGVFLDLTTFQGNHDNPDVDLFIENILEMKRQEEPIWQRQDDSASFRRKWITPFHNELTYFKFILEMREQDQQKFWAEMKRLLPEVTDKIVELLLDDLNKHYNLIGAYFAAFRHREQFAKHIGKALIHYPYNANVYCFALARFATPQAADILESYLTRHIPINEHNPVWDELSIDWAIAALQYIDEQLGTQRAKNYTTEDGVWDRWAGFKIKPARQELDKLLIVAGLHFR